MKLYLASANPHKARELQSMADRWQPSGRPIEVVSAAEAGGMPEVVEDTGTFVGNATKKARALFARLPPASWALADDSGICVDALGGQPGVESAYFAGPEGDSAANLDKLVRVMADVPEGSRGAHFVCVLVLIGPDGVPHAFEGRCNGHLLREPVGEGGFGYDPLFVPEGYSLTTAQMQPTDKNKISHRGLAWAKCVGWLAARGETVL